MLSNSTGNQGFWARRAKGAEEGEGMMQYAQRLSGINGEAYMFSLLPDGHVQIYYVGAGAADYL
jgi:hypothetical protein